MLVLPLQLQVDRISTGVFYNCPCVFVGVIIRQGMLSSSAIFAKVVPEKTSEEGPHQPNLPYNGDCRVDSMRIRQSLLFLQALLSQFSQRFPLGQDSWLRAEDLVLLECFLSGSEYFCWTFLHVCGLALQDVICGHFLLAERFCQSRFSAIVMCHSSQGIKWGDVPRAGCSGI